MVPGGRGRVLSLTLEFPDWSGRKTGGITTGVAGVAGKTPRTLLAAHYTTIDIPLGDGEGMRVVEIAGRDDFPLPAPDTRRRIGRLVSAGIRPPAP